MLTNYERERMSWMCWVEGRSNVDERDELCEAGQKSVWKLPLEG
jgi:hypothetical protein